MDIKTELPMADTDSGCACCSPAPADTAVAQEQVAEGTQTFEVTGLTCGHCSSTVTSEIQNISGVRNVEVTLVAGGTSTLSLTSDSPVAQSDVVAALDAAGGYQLVTS